MNTRLGKSFGLAFVVAVGILALMFALGTFSAQTGRGGCRTQGDCNDTSPSTAKTGLEATAQHTGARSHTIHSAIDKSLFDGRCVGAHHTVYATCGITGPRSSANCQLWRSPSGRRTLRFGINSGLNRPDTVRVISRPIPYGRSRPRRQHDVRS